jgi:hypothetical protein
MSLCFLSLFFQRRPSMRDSPDMSCKYTRFCVQCALYSVSPLVAIHYRGVLELALYSLSGSIIRV